MTHRTHYASRFTLHASRLALPLSAFILLPSAFGAPSPAVLIHADQPEGRFVAERVTNASVDAIYGQTTSPLADDFFTWVRATNALSYVRCYNWLGDGMPKNHPEWFSGCRIARSGPKGAPVYEWDGLERVLDTLVASGVKPVIVCGGLPDALASGPIRRNEGGAAVNRPKSYALYQDMITQMCRRLEKTYGAEEVRTWYFEVWSQPDHEGSWEGGRPAPFKGDPSAQDVAPFNQLYDCFAAGATAVDPKLRVGGPGLAGDRGFLKQFLAHCATGTNAVTHRVGTRLDFISWHRYGTPEQIAAWDSDLRGMVEREFPAFRGAQFILSESGAGPGQEERADTAAEAARLARLVDLNSRAARGMDLLFRTGDLADDHFNGSRPLLTRIGLNTVPTPAFCLFTLVSKLGTERLKSEVQNGAPGGTGVLATRPDSKNGRNTAQALVYRFDPSASGGVPAKLQVRFTGLPANLVRLPYRVYRIDPQTHAPYEAWTAAQRPRPGTEGVAPALKELGDRLLGKDPLAADEENNALPIQGGEATVEVSLPPNGVALVTLGAEPAHDAALCERGQLLRRAEEEFALAAEIQKARDFHRAEDLLRRISTKYAGTVWRQAALLSLVYLYELDLKSPEQAEGTRKEILLLPIDDFLRLRLLERLRVDVVRRGSTKQAADLTRQIEQVEKRLAAQRQWPLQRYTGG